MELTVIFQVSSNPTESVEIWILPPIEVTNQHSLLILTAQKVIFHYRDPNLIITIEIGNRLLHQGSPNPSEN